MSKKYFKHEPEFPETIYVVHNQLDMSFLVATSEIQLPVYAGDGVLVATYTLSKVGVAKQEITYSEIKKGE